MEFFFYLVLGAEVLLTGAVLFDITIRTIIIIQGNNKY